MTHVYQTHMADLDLFQDCGAEFEDLFPKASIHGTLESAKDCLERDVRSMEDEGEEGHSYSTFEWKPNGEDEWQCEPSGNNYVLVVYRTELL